MPPVMGAIAFVMCEIIGVPYHTIIVAAAIPAILYYFAVFMQVDAYAAKAGLKGLPKEEVPSLKKTLSEGWHFIAVFIFLLWGLMYMQWDAKAPFYASALLFVLSMFRKDTRMTPRKTLEAFQSIGSLIAQTVAILLPVGFIVCGLTITGVAAALTVWIVNLGAANVLLILIMGAAICYIMGMAGMAISAYVFLAVTIVPAVVQAGGLNVLATHLFVVYYDTLAGITLPVAAAAFLGAAIAGAAPMKTALTAMRLAAIIYFVPFFFVYNPALLFQGPIWETAYTFVLCLAGIVLIAGGAEGYLLRVGLVKVWTRPLLIVAGFLLVFPELITGLAGFLIALAVITWSLINKRRNKTQLEAKY
jgi:TRAP transporter 4TM/12TM fusion protein